MEVKSILDSTFSFLSGVAQEAATEVKPVLVSSGQEAIKNAFGIQTQVVSNDPEGQAALAGNSSAGELVKSNPVLLAAGAGVAAIALAIFLKRAKAG